MSTNSGWASTCMTAIMQNREVATHCYYDGKTGSPIYFEHIVYDNNTYTNHLNRAFCDFANEATELGIPTFDNVHTCPMKYDQLNTICDIRNNQFGLKLHVSYEICGQ